MIKMYCDRCGKEIEGTTYYTLSIYAEDINPIKNMQSSTTAMQNLSENMGKVFSQKKCYCEKCKIEIEKFIGRR